MEKPVLKFVPITKGQFAASGYEQALAESRSLVYLDLESALRRCAGQNKKEGKSAESITLTYLADICGMTLQSANIKQPYAPFSQDAEGSPLTIAVENISNKFIDFIASNYHEVKNNRLRARLADIIWLRKKDYKAALCAIDAYNADKICLGDWCLNQDYGECLERAVVLCKQLGWKEKLAELEQILLDLLFSASLEEAKFPGVLCGPADVLLRYGLARNKYSKIAALFKKWAKNRNEPAYYETAADFYKASKNLSEAWEMLFLTGRAFERGAGDNFMEREIFYKKAIGQYSKIPEAERISAFHRHSLPIDHIEKLRSEIKWTTREAFENPEAYGLKKFTYDIDMEKEAKEAQKQVAGKNFRQALFAIATLMPWVKEEDLLRHSGNAILPKIAQTSTISSDGRTVNGPNFELMKVFRMEVSLASICIRAALDVARSGHSGKREEGFLHLVKSSPIVPQDRERLIAKALFYGWQGDFAATLYLLAPQIENIIRYHFSRIGGLSSVLTEDKEETETSLNTLLDKPEIVIFLDKDVAFTLKMLFCEKSGPNLRNEVAHGLRNDVQSSGEEAIYAWWVLLKLVCSWICEGRVADYNPYLIFSSGQ